MIWDRRTAQTEKGLTLTELILSMAILSLIVVACVEVMAGALNAGGYGKGKAALLHSAQFAMNRMVRSVRQTTWVLIPLIAYDETNSSCSTRHPREILAVSGGIDNDNDGRRDEDPGSDITNDGKAGIMGIDDDGDGMIDEGGGGAQTHNDDEDEVTNDDFFDGVDDDGDCRIDEDPTNIFFGVNVDDDDDGIDKEDNFDPLIYFVQSGTLYERQNQGTVQGTDTAIAQNVSEFKVVRRLVDGRTLIDIHLKVDNGRESVTLDTTAFALSQFSL